MAFKRLKRLFIVLALIAIPIVYVGCGGVPAPAGPPTPPVETPSPLPIKFVEPEQLQIDFSSIAAAEPAAAVSKAVGPGGEFSSFISFGYTVVTGFEQGFLIPSLKGISEVGIPAGVETHADTVTFTQETGFLSGTHEVKLDFRLTSVDIDGDGTAENCGGDSGTLPVCIMFWLDDQRFSIWRIEEPINTDGTIIGKGFFKAYIVNFDGVDVSFAIAYEQLEASPDVKNVEYFSTASDAAGTSFGSLGQVEALNYHLRTTKDGPEASAFKDINFAMTGDFFDPGPSIATLLESQYIGRFVEGFDLWSGSFIATFDTTPDTPIEGTFDKRDICAYLSTGDGTGDNALCEDVNGFNLRDGNQSFIDPAQTGDFAIPPEFTPAPTF